METFAKDPFKMVEAWIISSDKRKVVGVHGEVGVRVWVIEGTG